MESRLARVREAIDELRLAAQESGDTARADTATWLWAKFAGVTDRAHLRRACREALTLYRGGMGSFTDVGNTVSAHAVERLRRALRGGL